MRDKVIYIDFSKNKKRHKKEPFILILKNILTKIFSSANKNSNSNKNKKVIYYNKDIS